MVMGSHGNGGIIEGCEWFWDKIIHLDNSFQKYLFRSINYVIKTLIINRIKHGIENKLK